MIISCTRISIAIEIPVNCTWINMYDLDPLVVMLTWIPRVHHGLKYQELECVSIAVVVFYSFCWIIATQETLGYENRPAWSNSRSISNTNCSIVMNMHLLIDILRGYTHIYVHIYIYIGTARRVQSDCPSRPDAHSNCRALLAPGLHLCLPSLYVLSRGFSSNKHHKWVWNTTSVFPDVPWPRI